MARILVVDDDPAFVEAAKTLLLSKGYEVISAANGEDGYRLAKTQAPDLMLLDVMMTYDSEGLDVARKLKEDPQTRNLPVICITGIRKAKNLGQSVEPDDNWLPVKAVLEKPVKPERLLQAVKDALRL